MIQDILSKVKQNKKYKTLADSIVIKEIKDYLKNQKSNKKEGITKQNITKQDIKNIRAKLHRAYSSFQTKKKNKRYQYLEDIKNILENKNPNFNNLKNPIENNLKYINEIKNPIEINKMINNLLSITLSTKERINDYPELYQQIFKITGKPETILDLGSGLNPLSYPHMNLNKKPLNYYAYDIDEEDMRFLNEFFKLIKTQNNNFNGKASILNIRELKNNTQVSKLPNADMIFLFKIIDIINQSEKNYRLSEELIKNLITKSKYIVASFATKTITRKKMNYPNRKWFELMLKRNNLNFNTIKTNNEIFYVISKS